MKKILALIVFSLSVFFAIGQTIYDDPNEDFAGAMQKNKNFRAHMAAEGIVSVKTIAYKHINQDSSLSFEWRYDNKGNAIEWFNYRRNGKIKEHASINYDDSNRVTLHAVYNAAGKMKSMYTYTYGKSGNPIEYAMYKHNPQLATSKTSNTYDDKNKITESKIFGKKGNLKCRIEYTYYTDGSRKQTIEYSGIGKVKRIWNFDCNPLGDLQAQKLKDTTRVCVHYESDKDGNPIKIIEEYKGAGMFSATVRCITKYDKENNLIDIATYKLNGKQISHLSIAYNALGNITEYNIYKAGTQKTWFMTTYTYNDAGNVSVEVIYWKAKQLPFATVKWFYSSSL